jgi:homogentisate 1,2-dioxygenase
MTAPSNQPATTADDITRVSHPGDGLDYLTGYGNHLRSEAVPGAVPDRINGPRHPPHGLFPELINGTGFTVARAHNLRTWTYRLRPAVTHRPFTPMEPGSDSPPPPHFVSDFSAALHCPEPQRYRPMPLPEDGHQNDFLDGIDTFAGAGSPVLGQGMAIHLWTASRDMERVFVNIDGDLLLAPETGRLRIRTELGWLDVAQGEIVVLPRGIRFQVFLPDGPAKGFAAELYDGHFQLPERGVVGSNGLADERHFKAPVASYENRVEDTVVVVKQGGRFWRLVSPHSPFDVVGWHGRYAPFKYDLRDFMSMGSVSFDHPDPSILTVLTHPIAEGGKNAVDVGVFAGRWEPTEQTFRPPFHHRNSAIEFNMVLDSPPTKGGYPQGAFSFTPLLTPHGLGSHAHHHHTFEVDDTPSRVSGDSLWLQFESAYQLGVLPRWLHGEHRDTGFLDQFRDYTLGPLAAGQP